MMLISHRDFQRHKVVVRVIGALGSIRIFQIALHLPIARALFVERNVDETLSAYDRADAR
jgi:hypothetical protein